MESAEIARRYLRYFEEKGHLVVPSASLVAEDPTLLLVPAGMVPFKPYFLAQRTPPAPRMTSCQKCVRTPDIEEVGKTTRHGTFFQMLGNFAIADYFKEQAIPYAWELLTKSQADGGFGFPEEKLWVTVLHDDDESAELWHKVVGVPMDRIQRRGLADNFWHMGVPGPGGPCSEIYYDRGPEHGRDGGPEADEDRYLEVWNLVFMQFQLGTVRSKVDFDITGELPAKNIDTGMGLERMAAILQGVDNIYETDTMWRILDRAADLTKSRYGKDATDDVSLRVVADHVRSGMMMVADGIIPSNEGRGYVLRRILRRAIRKLRLLGGQEGGLMHELTDTAIRAMGEQYPELIRTAANIHTVIDAEEESFLRTLRTGESIFDVAAAESKRSGRGVVGGSDAFKLHDTYGFPIELTLEMASEQGLKVDEDGFRRLMQEQRDRAKADAREKKTGNADVTVLGDLLDAAGGKTDFLGYSAYDSEARVVGLLVHGANVQEAPQGTDVEVVLDRTPFYAEGGGQLADHGVIKFLGGAEIEVHDVQSPLPGLIVHRGRVRSGLARSGDTVLAEIDRSRRMAISRSHSATHLVHAGFRAALGESAAQAGSENSPGRFRFDFTAAGAVPVTVLRDVEHEVNEVLMNDLEVRAFVTSQSEAVAMGAMALFGEKYGDEVRVVEIGEYSRELCGGTHVGSSGQLGLIKLMSESSIGAGVRRIEALVGMDAFRFLAKENVLVNQLADQVKARREELPERISGIVTKLREAEKDLERLRAEQILAASAGLAEGAKDVDGTAFVGHRAPDGIGADDLRKLAIDVRSRLEGRPAVVMITAVPKDRPVVVVAVNDLGRERGHKAGKLVGLAAKVLGGGGGGKDDLAQGGGADPGRIEEALAVVERQVGSA
ncbi:alanine--tRNA ligase [Actinocorallia sp. API 0066]|uniref:alanine--tRNA ligase n=1 Tax=Actinocorallia sp. API 0066 TaxID=2896846 RepID=UPI001E41D983|nr:alanine--tRNA ligase [Actinocorallia sp. API 0066]MCD0449006.1 alanine--tRNA ligase [Actinocorallia sp. API 0066]